MGTTGGGVSPESEQTWTLLADGAFQVPQGMTHDEFLKKLFDWLESFGAAWGGLTNPATEEDVD